MRKTPLVDVTRHHLRLVQQVPAGTPGAFVDAVFGRSWLATRKGINGRGGFAQADIQRVLMDAGEVSVTLPPTGTDGRSNRARMYFYSDTPSDAGLIGYMPGDEWIEVYRGRETLLASGTPVSEQGSVSQIAVTCRDVLELLKKTTETTSGYWCHSPRDVFEHYTRVWQAPVADDFTDQAQFPVTASGTVTNTPDNRWHHTWCEQSPVSGSFVRIVSPGVLQSRVGITSGPSPTHGCWRAEVSIPSAVGSGMQIEFDISGGGTTFATMTLDPAGAGLSATSTLRLGVQNVGVNAAGLLDPAGNLSPPYTLAIECRERFVFFFVNGQQVGATMQPWLTAPSAIFPTVSIGGSGSVDVDYMLMRHTTPPMNGGLPGDYRLAADPPGGGLQGEYFDRSTLGDLSGTIAPPTDPPTAIRVDTHVDFTNPPDDWMPAQMAGSDQRYARWTGAIYLPLHDQSIHFTIPAHGSSGIDDAVLYVGRTRDGEAVCSTGGGLWPGEIGAGLTSVDLRFLLGVKNGWYPIRYEYIWGTNPDTNTIGFTYDVGGAGTVPPPSVLSPRGIVRSQITGSHYDAIRSLAEQFVIQFRPDPRPLEDPGFPGVIIPYVRVDSDTDLQIDETQAIDPQSTMTAEDNATSASAQAQGLGGSSSGTLTAEAFNWPVLGSHPLVLSEAENLPGTSDLQTLASQLETLLALREDAWQDVQATTTGGREKRDTWPLSGELALFDWQPGKGVRINLPRVGIVDPTPRQILQVQRTVYPDGSGPPTVSFRPRARNFAAMLRRFIREVYTDRRTFQGQFVESAGNIAQGNGIALVALPDDLSTVRKAELVVLAKNDATTSWDMVVNGVTLGTAVTHAGTYDISQVIARAAGTQPVMVAGLVNASPGSDTVSFQLRIVRLI